MTHLPTTPSKKGHHWHNSTDSHHRKNIYVNPLGESQSFTNLPSTTICYKTCASKHNSYFDNMDFSNHRNHPDDICSHKCEFQEVFSDSCSPKIRKLDEPRANWHRVNSQPPLQGEGRYQGNGSRDLRLEPQGRPQGGSLKRHRSETSPQRHLHFGEVIERTFSSTDNIHDMQALPKPKLKFRKAVSLASKLHGSPSTGRKLANYHLIANPKSGMCLDFVLPFTRS